MLWGPNVSTSGLATLKSANAGGHGQKSWHGRPAKSTCFPALTHDMADSVGEDKDVFCHLVR